MPTYTISSGNKTIDVGINESVSISATSAQCQLLAFSVSSGTAIESLSGAWSRNYSGPMSVTLNNIAGTILASHTTVTRSDPLEVDDYVAHSAAHAVMGFNTYCQQAGVTGVNDGSRDDAPLLLAAYNAAVAAGAKSLVLPVGLICIKSRVVDASYPNDYVVRVASNQDDFQIVIPTGCVIRDYVTSAGSSGNANDIFQLMGNRQSIGGGGRFEHNSPGYGNNQSCAVHLTSGSDECYAVNLSVKGYCCTGYGAVDNSSSNRGTIALVNVEDCVYGVMQSHSTNVTQRGMIFDCQVRKFRSTAFSINGYDNQVVNCVADNAGSGYDAVQNAAIAHQGKLRNLQITNFMGYGDTTNGGSGYGIYLAPSSVVAGGKVSVHQARVQNFNASIGMNGCNVEINYSDVMSVAANFQNHVTWLGTNGKTVFKNLSINNGVTVFSRGAAATGDAYFDGVSYTGLQGSAVVWSTTNSPAAYVRQYDNVTTDGTNDSNGSVSRLPITLDKTKQRVASAASVTATAGINKLITILTGTTNTALTPPANPNDNQEWTLRSEGAIATFSFASGTFASAPSSLTAGYSRTFVYSSAISSWI